MLENGNERRDFTDMLGIHDWEPEVVESKVVSEPELEDPFKMHRHTPYYPWHGESGLRSTFAKPFEMNER